MYSLQDINVDEKNFGYEALKFKICIEKLSISKCSRHRGRRRCS